MKFRKGEKPGWHSYRQALDLLRQQEWNGALRLLAEAEVIFRTTNDLDGQWRALAAQAEIHMHEGMAPQAMARALAAMAIVEHLDDPRTCGLLAWRIALIALHQGDYRTGSAYLQRAQFCLDMADAAPPGGILASAAQICAEIARWQQVILQGRMTVDEGEAIINEARAGLMRCLLDIHRALTSRDRAPPESWAWVHTGLLSPPPPMLTAAPPRSLVQRFVAWWQARFASPSLQRPVERGDLGRFQALGRVIEMHGDAVTAFGHGLRAHPHADPTTPLRQQPAQAPTCPPPEQAVPPLRHAAPATALNRRANCRRLWRVPPLRHAAPATAQRRARRRWHPHPPDPFHG